MSIKPVRVYIILYRLRPVSSAFIWTFTKGMSTIRIRFLPKEMILMKAMILYYSKSGKTENLVHKICEILPCDTLKVEPQDPYGNYLMSVIRVRRERKHHLVHKTGTAIPDFQAYNLVFVGFPVWFNDVPAFFADFLSNCDLQGKIVVPFATSGMDSITKSLSTLETVCAGATVKFPFTKIKWKKSDTQDWLDTLKTEFAHK